MRLYDTASGCRLRRFCRFSAVPAPRGHKNRTSPEEISESVHNSATDTPFCAVAEEYDRKFTETELGSSKRELVHDTLLPLLHPAGRLLELNCGTGEDAVRLLPHLAAILATDASGEMIRVARRKAEVRLREDRRDSLRFAVGRIEAIAAGEVAEVEQQIATTGEFDLVFSNFDGINCVESLDPVARGLMRLVRPGGSLVLVFMSRHALIEKGRDLLRGRFARLRYGRALESGRPVRIGEEETITTWFPPVIDVERTFLRAGFVRRNRRAIGLFLPPTTMENFYERHRFLFATLGILEKPLAGLPVLDRCGDHVLLHFIRPGMCERA